MLTFTQFTEARETFPQVATNPHKGPLKITIRKRKGGDERGAAYTAHGPKNKMIGAAIYTWKDLTHNKPSIWKSETHADYRKHGVMSALYHHIEKDQGVTLHPSSTLSDDGHALWQKFRPSAVKGDLRSHKFMGKEVHHPEHGQGTIDEVGSGVVRAMHPNGKTSYHNREALKKQGFDVPDKDN